MANSRKSEKDRIVPFGVSLRPDDLEKLDALAKQRHRTRAALVRMILLEHLTRGDRPPEA